MERQYKLPFKALPSQHTPEIPPEEDNITLILLLLLALIFICIVIALCLYWCLKKKRSNESGVGTSMSGKTSSVTTNQLD
jgi:heme/copper-type cytochrome/quinol oxidase subunit 2